MPLSSDENLTLNVVPKYLERIDNFKKNNLIFDNLDIIVCWYTINGILKPSEHCTMDFSDGE